MESYARHFFLYDYNFIIFQFLISVVLNRTSNSRLVSASILLLMVIFFESIFKMSLFNHNFFYFFMQINYGLIRIKKKKVQIRECIGVAMRKFIDYKEMLLFI